MNYLTLLALSVPFISMLVVLGVILHERYVPKPKAKLPEKLVEYKNSSVLVDADHDSSVYAHAKTGELIIFHTERFFAEGEDGIWEFATKETLILHGYEYIGEL